MNALRHKFSCHVQAENCAGGSAPTGRVSLVEDQELDCDPQVESRNEDHLYRVGATRNHSLGLSGGKVTLNRSH
jgi:hypothetical protein